MFFNVFRKIEFFTNYFNLRHVLNHLKTIDVTNLAEFKKIGGFKTPDSFIVKSKNDQQDRSTYIPVNKLVKNGSFYSDTDKSEYLSLDKLLEISKQSATKFHCTRFTGDKFKNFLVKSKQLNAKLTGVFNTMFVIAWQMVYKKFDLKPDQINYTTIVNLRPHLSNIDPNSLVWLCNSLYSSCDNEINYDEDKFWTNEFWQLAKQESESFHARIKQGEQYRLHETLAPIETNECRIHFGLSNLVVPSQITERLKMFQLNEVYTLSSYRSEWSNDFGYNNIISIGDSLCWVISYNSYFVKNEIIKYFLDSVMFIYDKLCEQ